MSRFDSTLILKLSGFHVKIFYFLWELYKSSSVAAGMTLMFCCLRRGTLTSRHALLGLTSPAAKHGERFGGSLRVRAPPAAAPSAPLAVSPPNCNIDRISLSNAGWCRCIWWEKRGHKPLMAHACGNEPESERANLSWPDTMMATRSHTASASSM